MDKFEGRKKNIAFSVIRDTVLCGITVGLALAGTPNFTRNGKLVVPARAMVAYSAIAAVGALGIVYNVRQDIKHNRQIDSFAKKLEEERAEERPEYLQRS